MSASDLKLSRPAAPTIRDVVATVDMTLDPSQRPLCGHDIESFRASIGVPRSEFALAMALVPGHYLRKVSDQRPLALDKEILLRLYQRSPSPASWQSWSPKDAFDECYGELLRSFELPAHRDLARVMLCRRFTALMGRTSARAMSWMDDNGGYRTPVRLVLGKLIEFESPRAVLEPLAARAYAVRGLDLEQLAPLPTPASVSQPRPGRVPQRIAIFDVRPS